jgi:hypothetical protein
MTLLQPTDVPSRAGINNAITTEIAAHASTTDPNGPHYDSGWIDIPLRANRQASGEVPRYRRVGRQVFLRGRVAKTDATNFAANVQDTIGDLPAGFRPNPLTMWAIAGSTGTNSGGRFWITTAGEIIMQPQNATPNMSVATTFLNN